MTFKKADELREIAAQVPIDRLLVETDSPFLTPQPYRGKRNEPGYVYYVAERIAALRSMPLEDSLPEQQPMQFAFSACL
ncbi:MAG: TatD family hydrolase [Chloroflexota bacterium]